MRTLTVALVAALVLAVPMAAMAGPAVMAKIDANEKGASAGGSANAGGQGVARDVAVPTPPTLPVQAPDLPVPVPGVDASAGVAGEADTDLPVPTPALPETPAVPDVPAAPQAPGLPAVAVPEAPAVGAPGVEVPEVQDAGLATADLPVGEDCACEHVGPVKALLADLRAGLLGLLGIEP